MAKQVDGKPQVTDIGEVKDIEVVPKTEITDTDMTDSIKPVEELETEGPRRSARSTSMTVKGREFTLETKRTKLQQLYTVGLYRKKVI